MSNVNVIVHRLNGYGLTLSVSNVAIGLVSELPEYACGVCGHKVKQSGVDNIRFSHKMQFSAYHYHDEVCDCRFKEVNTILLFGTDKVVFKRVSRPENEKYDGSTEYKWIEVSE